MCSFFHLHFCDFDGYYWLSIKEPSIHLEGKCVAMPEFLDWIDWGEQTTVNMGSTVSYAGASSPFLSPFLFQVKNYKTRSLQSTAHSQNTLQRKQQKPHSRSPELKHHLLSPPPNIWTVTFFFLMECRSELGPFSLWIGQQCMMPLWVESL